ncbi:MAG TPA: tetratricopeptide repeat protein, partial [Cytophagales bacterium]
METTEDLQDRIDRYVLNRMDGDERAQFEALLHVDAGLRGEVAGQQKIAALLEKAGDYQLKKRLDQVYADTVGRENAGARRLGTGLPRTAWAVAASVVLLVALLLWLWGRPATTPDELFTEYYRPEPYLVTRGQADAPPGGAFFNQGNYRQALEAFGANLRQNPGADYDLLYAGLCYLELGDYGRAEESFTRVAGRSQLLRGQATWYLALTYLKHNEVAASKTQL